MATYSHRNGETELPTERGWYWVFVTAPYQVWQGGLMRFVETYPESDGDNPPDAWRVDSVCNEPLAELEDECRWWGPVVPPWNEQDSEQET